MAVEHAVFPWGLWPGRSARIACGFLRGSNFWSASSGREPAGDQALWSAARCARGSRLAASGQGQDFEPGLVSPRRKPLARRSRLQTARPAGSRTGRPVWRSRSAPAALLRHIEAPAVAHRLLDAERDRDEVDQQRGPQAERHADRQASARSGCSTGWSRKRGGPKSNVALAAAASARNVPAAACRSRRGGA